MINESMQITASQVSCVSGAPIIMLLISFIILIIGLYIIKRIDESDYSIIGYFILIVIELTIIVIISSVIYTAVIS
jgi:hypothetical protein